MLEKGILFDEALIKELKEKFYLVEGDPEYGERLFYDNSGGSLRLRAAVEAKAALEQYPDCPDRSHPKALDLKEIVERGTREILSLIFSVEKGSLITELTASQTMFHMVGLIMENVEGSNAVVSALEHPSAFDAVAFYCQKTGKELRVVPANPKTGEIEPEAVAALVDENTCLLSVMSASNVCGTVNDMKAIVEAARGVKPDLYIISDAVQHAPHCPLNVGELGLDGVNFAPYKFFGVRGCGFAYVSERVARFPHHRLLGKEQSVFALGTATPGNFAAMMAVIDYVCDIGRRFLSSDDRKTLFREGMERIHLAERGLLDRLLEGTDETPGLRHIPGVTVHVDALPLSRRDLIAAIAVGDLTPEECAAAYLRRGVVVCDRSKHSMYSNRIVTALGLNGCVRVSPMHCHGAADIDRFLRVTAEIAKEATR